MFFAIAAQMNYRIYGGDAKDTYAHSPPPHNPTVVSIDDAYAKWYEAKYPGKNLNRLHVLPVKHALQGHPESGKLWETHISKILARLDAKLTSTTHDKSIYRGIVDGTPIFLLRQVDDFASAAPSEDIAKKVYDSIGVELRLPGESTIPFKYLGMVGDFNGVDIGQFNDSIVVSCKKYID